MTAPQSIAWPQHADAIRELREQVFICEQAVPAGEEWDELDSSAHHVGIWRGQRLIAYARLLPSGQLTRMAVAAEHRRLGLGGELLRFALDRARAVGLAAIHLHAQVAAQRLYLRAGFEVTGPEFIEAGIAHVPMRLELVSAPVPLQGPSEALAALRRLLHHTHTQLTIASRALPPWLFGDAEVVELVSKVARHQRRAQVRILAVEPPLEGAHRLLHLAERLPSRMQVRRVTSPETPWRGFVAGDDGQLLYFSDESVPAGFCRLGARAETRAELERFAPLWEHASEPDPNLRRL